MRKGCGRGYDPPEKGWRSPFRSTSLPSYPHAQEGLRGDSDLVEGAPDHKVWVRIGGERRGCPFPGLDVERTRERVRREFRDLVRLSHVDQLGASVLAVHEDHLARGVLLVLGGAVDEGRVLAVAAEWHTAVGEQVGDHWSLHLGAVRGRPAGVPPDPAHDRAVHAVEGAAP